MSWSNFCQQIFDKLLLFVLLLILLMFASHSAQAPWVRDVITIAVAVAGALVGIITGTGIRAVGAPPPQEGTTNISSITTSNSSHRDNP